MSEIELRDNILRHSLQILRATAGEQAVVDEILRQLEKDLRKLLEGQTLTGAQKRQVEALIREADEIIEPAYAKVAKSFDARTLAVIVAEKTVETMGDVFPVDVSMPTQERLASLNNDVMIDGAPSSAWWERQAEDTKFRFGAEVRQGVINGETNERIVQRIVGKGGEPGIMEVQRRHARTLVHSSVMTAANDARLATFRKNKRLISGVRWLSTLDSHTCIVCAALDGKGWDLDGEPLKGTKVAFEAPPKHFSCRCVLSPIPKTFKDLGLDIPEPKLAPARASSDGPTDAASFDEFLKRQSPAFVDEVLGKERAAMFRARKITLSDLISGTGRELSLDELRERM